MFTSGSQGEYVAEKAEGDSGWLFPVGDEQAEVNISNPGKITEKILKS